MTIDLILGTAGHIDHGKTSLIRALTGVETDRLPEEKKRGITIELGFAHLELPPLRLGIVDVPGHERFIRNMLAGATGLDLVMLVVAADDSIKQQTREHLDILRLLNLRRGIIALTKCDLAEAGWLEMVEEEIRDLTRGSFLEGAPIVRTSSLTGEGIAELKESIATAAKGIGAVAGTPAESQGAESNSETPPQGDTHTQPFRMAIDRTFVVEGHGTVVTGSVTQGRLENGQELIVEPGNIPVRIRGLQNHDASVDEIHKGQRAAINLAGIHHTQTRRGQELASAGYLKPSQLMTVNLKMLESVKAPLKKKTSVRFHLGTAEVIGRLNLLGKDRLVGGEDCFAQLFLSEPCVATWDQPFVIRLESPLLTVGGGQVLVPNADKIRRYNDEVEGQLQALRSEDAQTRASAAVYFNGVREWQPQDLVRSAGVVNCQEVMQQLLESDQLMAVAITPTRTVHLQHLVGQQICERILRTLVRLHEENSLRTSFRQEELANKFDYLEATLFKALLERLKKLNKIHIGPRGISAVGCGPKLSANEKKLLEEVIRWFHQAGVEPPTYRQCEERATRNRDSVRQLISLAVANGDLVEISQDFFLHEVAERQVREKLEEHMEGTEGVTLSEIRDVLGTTRKYAVPLCEYLDKIGFTQRQGDVRILA